MEVRSLITFLGYKYDDTGVKKAEADVNTYKSGVLGLVTVTAAAVASFAHAVLSTIEFGEELQLTSQKLGIGVEQLQEFEFAAGSVGVSTEKFSTSLGILSKNLLNAQAGSKGAIKAFQELHINPSGFKDTSDLLFKIADKFAALPDGFKKAGIAKELFGRGGLAFIPFLDLGAEKIKALGKTARDLNVVMGEETTKAAKEAHEGIFQLGYILKSLERGIGATFIPAINGVVQSMIKWLEENAKLLGSGIKGFFDGIGLAIGILLKAFELLTGGLKALFEPFNGLEKYIKYLTGPIGFLLIARLVTGLIPWLVSLASAITGVDIAAAPWLGTLLGIVGILAGLGLAIQDIVYFFEGRPSLLGDLLTPQQQKDLKRLGKDFEETFHILEKMAHIAEVVAKAIDDIFKPRELPNYGANNPDIYGGLAKFFFKGGEGQKNLDSTKLRPRSERIYDNQAEGVSPFSADPRNTFGADLIPQPFNLSDTPIDKNASGKAGVNINVPINLHGGAAPSEDNLDKMKQGIEQVVTDKLEEFGYLTQRGFLPQLG